MFLAPVSPVELRLKPRTKCTFPGLELTSFLHVLKHKVFLSKLCAIHSLHLQSEMSVFPFLLKEKTKTTHLKN